MIFIHFPEMNSGCRASKPNGPGDAIVGRRKCEPVWAQGDLTKSVTLGVWLGTVYRAGWDITSICFMVIFTFPYFRHIDCIKMLAYPNIYFFHVICKPSPLSTVIPRLHVIPRINKSSGSR